MNNEVIQIKHLTKRFGKVTAVDDLSFTVTEGELFAFLGINGAGKSTTINILCGQLSADSGSVCICGEPMREANKETLRALGVVFQSSLLDRALRVKDNLESRGALYGIHGETLKTRILELAELLDFHHLMNRPLGKLSGGERRRIDIARALLHRPRILVLDEPTTGLDVQTRTLLWQVIDRLRQQDGMTVLLTTHYMEEVKDANRVVIIDHGRILAEGTPHELKRTHSGDYLTVYGRTEDELSSLNYPLRHFGEGIRLSLPDTRTATALITAHPELFTDYEVTKGTMDNVFLAVTGRSLKGGDEA